MTFANVITTLVGFPVAVVVLITSLLLGPFTLLIPVFLTIVIEYKIIARNLNADMKRKVLWPVVIGNTISNGILVALLIGKLE